jgi:ubiquinone/menaquinone biosynthesis C-methylase UbiE
MNKQAIRHIAEAYGRSSEIYVSILEPRLQPIADEIQRIVMRDKGTRMLDLATGTGLLARSIAQTNKFVIGVDIAHKALITAQRLSMRQIPFVVGDAHTLPFADECVDLVTCGLGLSHFPDVSMALREVRRILRTGGRLVVTAWNTVKGDPLFSAASDVLRKYLKHEENPFKEALDEETWGETERGCKVLRQAGFEEVHVTTRLLSGRYRTPREVVEYVFAWVSINDLIAKIIRKNQERVWNEAISAVMKFNDLRQQVEIHYYQAIKPGT